MTERIPIQELAAVLVAKGGLKKKDAENFAMTVFDIVKDRLAADRLVKIKGLGTFKVIDIDSRESVNVNTGERVLIEGHEKVTFTPDTAMKDLVNKPFSQFETVVLNEGVDFSEMVTEEEDDDEQMTPSQEEPEPELHEPEPVAEPMSRSVVEPVVEQVSEPETVAEPEPEQEPEPDPEQKPEPEQEPEPEPVIEPLKAVVEEEPAEEDSCDTAPREQKRAALSPILTAVLCLLCFGIGYFLGGHDVGSLLKRKPTTIINKEKPFADTLKSDTIPSDSVRKDTIVQIITPEEIAEEIVEDKPEEKPEVKPEPKPEVKPEPKPEPTTEALPDYGKMDERVRTGAYRIVGTAEVVTVRAGETVYRLSNRYLGPGMECYVEVYNGITAENPLKEGQELKIPKLEVKKKKK